MGYPFSCFNDVHLDIEYITFLFVEFDLIQANFQLRVAEESVHLLVFICPYGKYAMLRVLMGWTSSGDYLNIETRCLLSRLDRSIKIFDDIFLQPQSESKD